MEIRNVRPYDVEFDGQLVPARGVLEVDEKLGKQLLKQEDNWREVEHDKAPAKKAASTTTKES